MKKKLFDLRPTQFAIGLKEVEFKVKKLKAMKDSELEDYLKEHPVPVILCMDQQHHIIDHHHLVRACWELGVDHVTVEVVADFSDHNEEGFWKKMKAENFTHLYDQFGKGPHPHVFLPHDIRGLADAPYRSLAWIIREDGGFEKDKTPFSEFKWADFFREKIVIERTENGYDNAKKEAMKLAKSDAAKHLPGYIK